MTTCFACASPFGDWREWWEEKDKEGDRIVDVWEVDGKPMAFMWKPENNPVETSTAISLLIPKKKPPTYRPYKRGEVKCGDVFVGKRTGFHLMVTCITDSGVCLGPSNTTHTYDGMLEHFTHLDGTPAGVAE